MLDRMRAGLLRVPAAWRVDSQWFLVLLSLLPAIRADLLFPHHWLAGLGSGYALPPIDNIFGVAALLCAGFSWLLTEGAKTSFRYLVVLPWLAMFLAGGTMGQALGGLSSVYIGLAFAAYSYFIVAGRVIAIPFFAFVGLLAFWQPFDGLLAWPQILVFVFGSLVMSLAVEAVRQNLPLARQLGRASTLALVARSFALWWPTLILIALGLWASDKVTSSTEQMIYQRGFVDRYCTLNADDPNASLVCPDDTYQLRAKDIRLLPPATAAPEKTGPDNDLPPRCWRLTVPDEEPLEPMPAPASFTCPQDHQSAEAWTLLPLPLFQSLDLTVARSYDIAQDRLDRLVAGVSDQSKIFPSKAEAMAADFYEIVPESTGMTTKPCKFGDLKCGIVNLVVDGLNTAFLNGRNAAEEKFIEKMGETARGSGQTVQEFAVSSAGPMKEELRRFKRQTRQALDRVRSAANLLQQVLLLWLVVIAIKSFLYVFARVIFDQSTDIDVEVFEREHPPTQGTVSSLQEVNIGGDYPYDIYYKANYQPLGPAPRFSIPQWRASLLSRLRFGAWNMSRVDMPCVDERGVSFNSIEAEHLIDWEMRPGEEVVFSYRNFVAMNENVELRTVISLRVASLLLGRIIFHTARCTEGPGRLILRTRGKPATAAQVRQSIPAARLVAWNRYAIFSVDSHLTCADIFLNGFNLRRSDGEDQTTPQGILIVEADARDGGLLVGTMRFAKNFLLPV